jgi:hypothetical protein
VTHDQWVTIGLLLSFWLMGVLGMLGGFLLAAWTRR